MVMLRGPRLRLGSVGRWHRRGSNGGLVPELEGFFVGQLEHEGETIALVFNVICTMGDKRVKRRGGRMERCPGRRRI